MRRLGSGLALVVFASVVTAAPAFGQRRSGYQVGGNSVEETFRFPGDYDRVVRVQNPAVWRDGKLYVMSSATRAQFAATSEAMSRKLRHDPSFVSKFGEIVAKATVENDSWVAERTLSGSSLASVREKKQEHAQRAMREVIDAAKAALGTSVSEDPSQFTFDSYTGDIRGWKVTPPRPAGEKTAFELVRPLGEGANARAYEVRSTSAGDSRFRVIKVLKPYAPRRTPEAAEEKTLAALSDEAEYLAKTLQRDAEFDKRFGADVIPKTISLAPGVIAQEMASGNTFDSLGRDAQERAREEIAALRKIADRVAPGVIVTARTKNYLFKKDGRIASLYDIASDGHKAYRKAGLEQRVWAHKGEKRVLDLSKSEE
jgi:hypothetical protein